MTADCYGKMTGRCLRQRPRISYYEPDEPNLDEFVYCDKCGDLVYEYCSIHGPLLVVPDTKVTAKPNVPFYVPRAALTIPDVFLHLAPSSIPEAGLGVFTTLTLPARVRFGPYTGQQTDGDDSYYCWQIYDSNRKPSYCIDAADASQSNWMRYVNCARHWSEQNLVAFQYQGQLYYRTVKIIPRHTELLVFYGSEFANELDIDLGKYNSPLYARVYSTSNKKRELHAADPNLNNEEKDKEEDVAVEGNINNDRDGLENADKSYTETSNFTKNNDLMVDTVPNDENAKQNNEDIFDLVSKNKSKNNIPVERRVLDSSQTTILYHVCDTCNEKFVVKSDLEKHMRFHNKNRMHECNICSYRFDSMWNLRYHTFCKHQINDQYFKLKACEICQRTFSKNSNLKIHMRTHTGEKPYSCETCKNKFSDSSSLRRHKRIHTGEKPFSCETCNSKFSSSSVLKKHMRTHTGEKPYSCETCKNKFSARSSLRRHTRTHTGEKPFSCETCNSKFTSSSVLKIHIRRTHTGEKPFSCETCNSKFTSSSVLKIHRRTHTGEKPYSCETCKNKFSARSSLRRHTRTHTGEKPFSCETCNSKFTSSSVLKIHMRTHTGEKPFSCETCNSKFSSSSVLKIHRRTHTGEKPFSCEMCNSKFTSSSVLKIHRRTHTGEKPYSCDTCKNKFSDRSSLRRHTRTHTGEKPF